MSRVFGPKSNSTMPSAKQKKGYSGERLAASWLEERGYIILESNYRFMKAEVDLIAFLPAKQYERGGDLVFVEVKWRRNDSFSPPEAAVNHKKRNLLVQAAEAFLHERKLEGTPCRFDIITLTGSAPNIQIEHFESAFMA